MSGNNLTNDTVLFERSTMKTNDTGMVSESGASAATDGHVGVTGPEASVDWGFRGLLAFAVAIAIWLLLMPFVPAIARSTMNRFHLTTESFFAWAIQQPIPPMYSFANRTEVYASSPADATANRTTPRAARMINHFPTREFTFANARVRHLSNPEPRVFLLRSSYRGQTVETCYELKPNPFRGWDVIRLSVSGERETGL
jgi:hypothetical protein